MKKITDKSEIKKYRKLSGFNGIESFDNILNYIVNGENEKSVSKFNFLRKRKKKDNFDNMLLITGKNVKKLTDIFGKHSFGYRGEFLFRIWLISFKDEIFAVESSNKGTSIYIKSELTDDKSNVIIEFLDEYVKILS